MRVLITGGAGFVGSHLADALLERGALVTVIDDLSTGSIENLRHLKGQPGFTYVIDTVMNRRLIGELVDEADVVYHLAAAVGVRLIVESPVRTIDTNVKSTETVLEMAAKKRKTVLIASTSEVYGKSNEIPFKEDGDSSSDRPSRAGGATPAPRRSTSSWAWLTGVKSGSPWSWFDCSTPLGRARRGATAWCFPTSCARRCWENPSPCSTTASSRAASHGWVTRSGR